MAKPKVDIRKLGQMLRAGKTVKECAKFFEVTPGAISQHKKNLNVAVVKSVVLENAHRVVDKSLNAVDQLYQINQIANRLLDELIGEDQTVDRMVKAVNGFLMHEGDPIKQKEHIRRVIIQVNQNKNTALKACGEIRSQLTLQMAIFETLYDMRTVQDFQSEVLEIIGSVSKEARDEIIKRLREKQALRSVIRCA
jgi:hypothetical protein